MNPAPWETALGALDVFERVISAYYQYDAPVLQQQRLENIASAKEWVRKHRDGEK